MKKKEGEVITSANNQPISSIEQLKAIAKEHPNKLLLKVQTEQNRSTFVVLEN